jgi:hypothetical protein
MIDGDALPSTKLGIVPWLLKTKGPLLREKSPDAAGDVFFLLFLFFFFWIG